MRALVALLLAFACDDDDLSKLDGGTADTGADVDGGAPVGADVDAGSEDTGPFACDPLSTPNPETPAAITGLLEVIDYDFWDDLDGERGRVRNFGFNFLTGTLPPIPLASAVLFPAIPIDQCEVVDILLPMDDLGPPRNIGARISIQNEAGDKSIALRRIAETGGIRYTFDTTQDAINFSNAAYFSFGERWTYETDGDSAASIRPASATLDPFDDFTLLSPAVSSSSTAVPLDGDFTWTSTGTKGLLSIVLGRALDMNGDGRYAICNVEDDGSFTLPSGVLADFGPTPGLGFDVIVSRASAAPFCNEGVTSGLVLHVLAYIGAGVVP